MSDLSLEDQNFAESQTELIASHDPGDDYIGEIILQIRPVLTRDKLRDSDLFTPLNRLTGLQAQGKHESGGAIGQSGIGVMGIGDGERQGRITGIGVFGQGSTGVRGETHGAFKDDTAAGVLGEGFDNGVGVEGHSSAFDGVVGFSDANDKSGVYGFNSQTQATAYGVFGRCSAPDGAGVGGDSDVGAGVWGHSSSNDGIVGLCDATRKSGVYGFNSSAKDVAFGVFGRCNSPGGAGVSGANEAGDAVSGFSKKGVGVRGTSAESSGVHGHAEGFGQSGVYGENTASPDPRVASKSRSTQVVGVTGRADSGSGVGVQGQSASGVGLSGMGGVYGARLQGGRAPLRLMPAASPGAPVSGLHSMGELYVDNDGKLFFCKATGSPGVWVNIA